MSKPLVIWGASHHALVVADIVRAEGEFEIVGYVDDVNLDRKGSQFGGATILGGQEELLGLRKNGVDNIILAIGDGHARLRLADVVRSKRFSLARAIHPRAVIASDAKELGAGTVIAAGGIVNPGARIGQSVIINTAATVEHECVIADGAHVSAGVHLGGNVHIGRATVVEIGTIVGARVRIGAGSIIGAGSLVLHDVPDGVLAYGSPARVKRQIPAG